MTQTRQAVLYRMVLPTHECPYGLRSKQLLEEAGFEIEEHLLTSREQVDAFKAEHGLDTTPLILIDGEEIGGSSELASYLETASARS
ncbi:MAG TPA: glutathione S-transferase N-terminal domain-containing protein [Sphingomicrobium sp.]|nr:glutathione S-transferase N-terminal domain-containing protein [Sphingomicrobium sp.]